MREPKKRKTTAETQRERRRGDDAAGASVYGPAKEITERGDAVTFAVRAAPRASRNAIEGEYQGALKVRLTAPPVDDRANEALRRMLAERLNVPLSAVRIVSGEKSRTKKISVAGISRDQVAALFAKA